ncbi:MAG: TetR/AcrR family transcriptional regulator [Marinosulfonomonas sp.]|nr:TetR/AcrR family transcriptional regulator [Marinosulfonomonas sp.]
MIADRLNLTQPAIYKHFSSKDDIWAAVATYLSQKINDNVTRNQSETGAPDTQVRSLVLDHLELVRDNPALPEIMLMRDAKGSHAIVQTSIQPSIGALRAALVANATDAVKQGLFRADIDVNDIATLIFGIIQSLVLRMLVTRDPEMLISNGERLLDLQLSGFMKTGDTQ